VSSKFTYLIQNMPDQKPNIGFVLPQKLSEQENSSELFKQISEMGRIHMELETLSNECINYSGRPLFRKSGVKRVALEIKPEGSFLKIVLDIY
jgi:hypothetical protein